MSKQGSSAYTVIIEADTAEELRTKVLNLAASYTGGTTETAPASAPSSEGPKSSGKKPKKETPPSEEKAADTSAAVDPFASDEEEAPEVEEEKKYTFDEIKAAAQKFAEKQGGLPKLTELLAKYNDKNGKPVVKITALLDKDYPSFVAASK